MNCVDLETEYKIGLERSAWKLLRLLSCAEEALIQFNEKNREGEMSISFPQQKFTELPMLNSKKYHEHAAAHWIFELKELKTKNWGKLIQAKDAKQQSWRYSKWVVIGQRRVAQAKVKTCLFTQERQRENVHSSILAPQKTEVAENTRD